MTIAPVDSLKLISREFRFTEGATVNKNGDLFFTDQPNNRIWKYDTNDKLSIFMESAGRSNGMCFNHHGDLLTCADEKNELWRIGSDGQISILASEYEGRRLNGPNDVWCHPSGDIYFSDPYYLRPYWKTSRDIQPEYVYLITPSEPKPRPVIRDLQKPNGITGSPDGKFLYVGDIDGDRTLKFPILHDGKLGKGELFANIGSDGMTVDSLGHVYLTGNGVTVFDPNGIDICHIPVPEKWTANVEFGGEKNRTLFITASKGLYRLEMNVSGCAFGIR